MFLSPLHIGHLATLTQFVLTPHKDEPNVHIWVQLFKRQHLRSCLLIQLPLGLNVDAVGEQEIGTVRSFQHVVELVGFVLERDLTIGQGCGDCAFEAALQVSPNFPSTTVMLLMR